MIFKDVIRKKRDGHALSAEDIRYLATGLADDTLPAEQISALAMAIYFRSMDFAETAALTMAMADSGTRMHWDDAGLAGPVIDKHSTGGVGDKVSFLLAPIAAACGCFVPMISGRSLGHTGGTLDKLDSIPGYQTVPSPELFRSAVKSAGCAIIGQTGDLAPADRKFYAIRDVTATVESIPLITASILSKKIAAGNQALVMDVKTGSGAFMETLGDARALARSIIGTAAAARLPTRALITDMSQTLGSTAGNALEIAESVAYLTGGPREPRLDAVVLALAAEMLVMTGLAPDHAAAQARAQRAVQSGEAAERFSRMIAVLGGPADFLERAQAYLPAAPVTVAAYPAEEGFIASVDARATGNAIIALGGGRRMAGDVLDLAVGFSDVAPIGARVGAARPLALVHARTEEQAAQAIGDLRAATRIAATAPEPKPVVFETLVPPSAPRSTTQ